MNIWGDNWYIPFELDGLVKGEQIQEALGAEVQTVLERCGVEPTGSPGPTS